ncbi:MAG TPA: tRNA threonylcarbamoyladenosine dehydratase [Firmicutes bacterium]|nr:tRNA threonylcarbamoyladenosine dehydratase [Bacillota bacterium]
MREQFSRTALLIGDTGLACLAAARVAVFGIGGVGSYAVEALARAGVGHLVLVDHDRVAKSNLNRQLEATWDTLGRLKVEAMAERIHRINPEADVETLPTFYNTETAEKLVRQDFDYILDAMDTLSAKVDLICRALALGVPIISSMGAGNRLEAGGFRVADIGETWGCPLARAVRRALKERGITRGVKVVFSPDPPLKPLPAQEEPPPGRRSIAGSISFVPPVVGLFMAGECVRSLLRAATVRSDQS